MPELRRLFVLLVLGGLFVGQATGSFLVLGFVETDSMEPSLAPGDGFVAVPGPVAGGIEPGDVVVYRATHLQGGGLVTHRVVDVRGDRFVTKGDANPFTDQANVEPPVRREQIVAEAVQVGGHVLVLPAIGTAVETVRDTADSVRDRFVDVTGFAFVGDGQSLLRGIAVASLLAFVLSGRGRRTRGDRDRERDGRSRGVNTWTIALAIAVVVVLGPTVGAISASGTQQVGVIAAHESEDAVAPGGTKTGNVSLENGGVLPMTVRVDAPAAVTSTPDAATLGRGERLNATLSIAAPEDPGRYQWPVTYTWYPAVLPASIADALYRVHPWLPLAVIDLLLGTVVCLGTRGLLGSGRVRLPDQLPSLDGRRSRN